VTERGLAPSPPERLLEELAASPTAPEVTLHLASGRELRGRVLAVAGSRDGVIASLRASGDRFAVDEIHVRVARIDAITLHDPRPWRAAPPGDPALGKLEVRRVLTEAGARLAAAGGPGVLGPPEDIAALADAERAAIAAAVPELAAALLGVLTDDLGRAALAGVETVALAIGPAAAARTGARFTITVPLSPAERPSQWATVLEAAL
jgi:hypothetical protein